MGWSFKLDHDLDLDLPSSFVVSFCASAPAQILDLLSILLLPIRVPVTNAIWPLKSFFLYLGSFPNA